MTKQQMIKNLDDEGFYGYENLKWSEFQTFYKDKMQIVKDREGIVSKPSEKSVEENLERKIKDPKIKQTLEEKRAELFPKIVDIMGRLKGKSRATQQELREMFNLYNAFYLRNDNPSCGSCVGRVFETFKKICKGRY